MTTAIRFVGLPTATVDALQTGAPDANGQIAEQALSDGNGVPCRHCLAQVAADEPYLILAHRPFATVQPYAECGPIFLHADSCPRYAGGAALPPMLGSPHYIVRGYSSDERIRYGTGRVVPTAEIAAYALELFAREDVAFLHVRSATNNCYQCRIERA